jgi:hypothetical protein
MITFTNYRALQFVKNLHQPFDVTDIDPTIVQRWQRAVRQQVYV